MSNRLLCRLIAFVALFLGLFFTAATSECRAEEPSWPQFRGKNAAGVAEEGRYPVKFGPELNVLWKAGLPPGVSSPCIWGSRIFMTAHLPDEAALETICLDRSSGAVLWRKKIQPKEMENVHGVSSPASATPATDGERVYIYFASTGLLCYDFDGELIWERNLPVRQSAFGSGTSPIVVGGVVILKRDDTGFLLFNDCHLLAVDSKSGQTRWETKRPASFTKYTTPVHWRHDEKDEIIVLSSTRLAGFDLASGKELWSVEGLPHQTCGTPVIAGDRIYLSATGAFGEPENFVGMPTYDDVLKELDGNGDGTLAVAEIPQDLLLVDRRASGGAGNSPILQFEGQLDPNRDGKITPFEWNLFREGMSQFGKAEPGVYSIELGGTGNVTSTNIKWHDKRAAAEVPSPLLYGDRLYIVRNGGIVHCRDVADGREVYRGRLDAPGGYYASPVVGDDKIYFSSDQGRITVLAAGDSLKVLAQNDLGDRIMATPALVDNTIYVRTDRHLYAFRDDP